MIMQNVEMTDLPIMGASGSIRWLLLERAQELGDQLVSYGISFREAAIRGSDTALRVHARQLRLVLIDSLGITRELIPLDGEA